jgi:thymidylate synthase ThyX
LRAFHAGQTFRFDILMDIGGFRDMHRHRRCVQLEQEFTTLHGYDLPEELQAAGTRKSYDATMQQTAQAIEKLVHSGASEAEEDSQYALPLGFRKRTLFKMDFAEALYISELRSGPAGHFSYRRVAYAMYEAVAKRYPAMAKYFRVSDVKEPVDLLKR